MQELCDRCDFKKSDGSCDMYSEKDRRDVIDSGSCKSASIEGSIATMTSSGYYFARRWYRKHEKIRILV